MEPATEGMTWMHWVGIVAALVVAGIIGTVGAWYRLWRERELNPPDDEKKQRR